MIRSVLIRKIGRSRSASINRADRSIAHDIHTGTYIRLAGLHGGGTCIKCEVCGDTMCIVSFEKECGSEKSRLLDVSVSVCSMSSVSSRIKKKKHEDL